MAKPRLKSLAQNHHSFAGILYKMYPTPVTESGSGAIVQAPSIRKSAPVGFW